MLKGGATRLVFHAYLCYYRLSWLILQSRFSNLRTMEKSCFMDLQTKGDFTTWPLILSRMRRLRSWNVYFCSLCTWWHFQIWHWMLVNKVFTGPLQLLWISFFLGGDPLLTPFTIITGSPKFSQPHLLKRWIHGIRKHIQPTFDWNIPYRKQFYFHKPSALLGMERKDLKLYMCKFTSLQTKPWFWTFKVIFPCKQLVAYFGVLTWNIPIVHYPPD